MDGVVEVVAVRAAAEHAWVSVLVDVDEIRAAAVLIDAIVGDLGDPRGSILVVVIAISAQRDVPIGQVTSEDLGGGVAVSIFVEVQVEWIGRHHVGIIAVNETVAVVVEVVTDLIRDGVDVDVKVVTVAVLHHVSGGDLAGQRGVVVVAVVVTVKVVVPRDRGHHARIVIVNEVVAVVVDGVADLVHCRVDLFGSHAVDHTEVDAVAVHGRLAV